MHICILCFIFFLMENESLEQADNQSRSRKQDGEKTSSLGSSERQNQNRNLGHHYNISHTLAVGCEFMN